MSEPSSKDTVLKTAMTYVCGGKNYSEIKNCVEIVPRASETSSVNFIVLLCCERRKFVI